MTSRQSIASISREAEALTRDIDTLSRDVDQFVAEERAERKPVRKHDAESRDVTRIEVRPAIMAADAFKFSRTIVQKRWPSFGMQYPYTHSLISQADEKTLRAFGLDDCVGKRDEIVASNDKRAIIIDSTRESLDAWLILRGVTAPHRAEIIEIVSIIDAARQIVWVCICDDPGMPPGAAAGVQKKGAASSASVAVIQVVEPQRDPTLIEKESHG
jgi:hypothetical protein